MSAWTVEKAHIDVLVNAAAQYGLIRSGEEASDMGAMLWQENYRSVNYRYSERTRIPRYRPETSEARFEPIAVLKAIACYEYQSCERPDWTATEAFRACQRLREAIEKTLPADMLKQVRRYGSQRPAYTASREYDTAPWSIGSLSDMPLATSA